MKQKICFLTSIKKASILESLKTDIEPFVEFEILSRSKDEQKNKQVYTEFISKIPPGITGILSKESPTGKMVTEWKNAIEENNLNLETVDISQQMAVLMAAKDEEELKAAKMAAKLTSLTLNNYFIDHITKLIDSGKRITHEQLTDQLEQTHLDERKRAKLQAPDDVFSFN